MLKIDELKKAGVSNTAKAWLTNPARRLYFKLGAPYFARQIRAADELEHHVHVQLQEIEAKPRSLENHVHVKLQEFKAELNHIATEFRKDIGSLRQQLDALPLSSASVELHKQATLIDGLAKDNIAVGHRFNSIEAQLAATSVRLSEEFQARTAAESNRTKQGLSATLPYNDPLSISGTSLVIHDGIYGRFLLRKRDLISEHIVNGGFWDAHLKSIIERSGHPSRSAIDAGAYLGFHSVYMSRYFHTVHSFEPQDEMFRMLNANLLLNGCHNVRTKNGALYDSSGWMRLAKSESQEVPIPMLDGQLSYEWVGNAAALSFEPAQENDKAAVPCMMIDDLMLPDLGFIKIDTQGSDLHVLLGAKNTIEQCKPIIVAEYERELAKAHGTSFEDFQSFFNQVGYEIIVLDDRGAGKQIDILAKPIL